jgi:AbrB family looped-hinge helix DNA binding protein
VAGVSKVGKGKAVEKAGWHFVFPIGQFRDKDETEAMRDFLLARLRKGNTFKFTDSSLTILSPTKDEGFKAAVFVANENPLNRNLFYTVHGYDSSGKLFFDSSEKRKINQSEPIIISQKIGRDGRITIPKEMRIVLNLVEGDVVTLKLDEKKIVVQASWRSPASA